MRKAAIILWASALLFGCENPNPQYYDQDVRREVFLQCLTSVPKGPDVTKYNDWAEVVDSCGVQAGEIAWRGRQAWSSDSREAAGATAP